MTPEIPEYVRIIDGRLQTAVHHYLHADPPRRITVIGTHHFGTPAYWTDIRARIDRMVAGGAVVQCEYSNVLPDAVDVSADEQRLLSSCVEMFGTALGRSGFFSEGSEDQAPIWNPETAWMDVAQRGWYDRNVIAVDGPNGRFVGYTAFKTGYGRVVFGVQHQATRGRWGTYSLETNRFHPSQGWMPLSN